MEIGSTLAADDEAELCTSDADAWADVAVVVRVGASGGAVACGMFPVKVESNTRVEDGALMLEAVLTPERFVGTARGSEGC